MSTPLAAAGASPTPAPTTTMRAGGARNAAATLAILVVTGAVILAAAYFSNPRVAENNSGDFTAVSVDSAASGAAPVLGGTAPDFAAQTADGTEVRLSQFIGKPVWLTFGASWCQPCRAENPDIQATYVANADQVVLLQVYMDEDAAAVSDYTGRVGISYLTVPDPNERLAAQYRILGIPSHFFIDSAGILRQIKVGSLDPAAMQAALDQIRE